MARFSKKKKQEDEDAYEAFFASKKRSLKDIAEGSQGQPKSKQAKKRKNEDAFGGDDDDLEEDDFYKQAKRQKDLKRKQKEDEINAKKMRQPSHPSLIDSLKVGSRGGGWLRGEAKDLQDDRVQQGSDEAEEEGHQDTSHEAEAQVRHGQEEAEGNGWEDGGQEPTLRWRVDRCQVQCREEHFVEELVNLSHTHAFSNFDSFLISDNLCIHHCPWD